MFQQDNEYQNAYSISQSLSQEDMDNITHLTSIICGTPISLITIINGENLLVRSQQSTEIREIQLSTTFCHETISKGEVFIVEDTCKSKYGDKPSFVFDKQIRFYAGAPLKSSDGFIIGTICVMDTEPRKLSNEQVKSLQIFAKQIVGQIELEKKHKELKAATGLLEKIMDAMPLAVTVTAEGGKVFYSNQKSLELLGRNMESHLIPDEIAVTYNLRFAGESEPYKSERSPTCRAARGESVYLNNLEIHRADKIIPLQAWASPIVNDGKISHTITVFDDISEQKRIEKKLKESEGNYRNLIEDIGDVVYKTDPKGNFTFINNRVTKLVGYQPEELMGKHYSVLVHPDAKDSVNAFYYKQFKEKKEETILEFPVLTKGGEKVWVEQSARIWWEDNGNIKNFHCMVRNIELRKQTESALIEAKQFAEDAKQLQEVFLANMSHEVRTPMNGVLGVANLLAQTDLSEKQKEYVNAIQQSGSNLMVIINDILDLTKIKSGKMTFENTPFDLKEVIDTTAFLVQKKISEKGLLFSVDLDKDLETKISGDPTRLSQILTNLIGNAVKFTEQGFVKLRVLKESNCETKINLIFKIEDSGIGISKEKIAGIFEKFMQANTDTTRKFGGTGLGLSISKQLIELQNGTIEVISEVGVGSCFTFRMSFDKILGSEKEAEVIINETKKSLEGIRILLAEDNEINQMVAVDTLERWQAVVEVVENGEQVLERMKNNAFDLILMDLQMPEMGGEECTKILRNKNTSNYSNVPIIAMTASAFKKEKEKCIGIGMNGYVSKPFYPDDLYQEIAIVLNKA